MTATPASLTFTIGNWNTAQPVTVTAGQDDDGIDDNPMLVHTASGGDYGSVTGTVSVTVMDDDTAGLTLTPGSVDVDEGGPAGTYTVVLDTEPTATVTVAIPAVGDVTAAPASLTFTTGNWNTAQPVTVTAGQDDDGIDDNPMLVHTASGGDYASVTGTVTVTVMDDDTAGLTLTPGSVDVDEGGPAGSYTVVLDTEPTATVTVAIPAVGDVTATPASLTFTTGNWNAAQPVTVTAGEDADGNDDNPMLVHTASGGDYDAVTGTVSVTVMDDDRVSLTFNPGAVNVNEGGTSQYTVVLDTEPIATVTVAIPAVGDVTATPASLTFTTGNWNTAQPVTVTAGQDADGNNDNPMLVHTASGGDYGSVTGTVSVRVTDDDTAGLTLTPGSVDVDEGGPAGTYTVVLDTEPTATVTVAIPAVGDVTATPASLTFTTGNWNTAQPVTVTAGQDADGIDDNPMLVHTASGGDYGSVTGTVSVRVTDDDTAGLTLTPETVDVDEGGPAGTYTVVLDTEPTATVTVAIPAVGDVTAAPASLTFTTGNWNTAQPVTVTAGQDADGIDDNPMLVHTASGGDYGSVTGTVSVRVTDDDTAGLTLTPETVDVDEGGPAGTYTVVLDTEPTATVTVAIPAVGDVTAMPASLTFTTGNWDTAQPVTITAGQDADGIDDNPMLVHTASGGDYGSVTGTVSVRVTDDDTAGLTLTPETVDVDEGGPAGTYTVVLDTEPTATVTVAIPAVGDVTAAPASLTFTTGNWNTAQPVTVTAGQDADGIDDNPMLVHTASGGDYGSVAGTVSVRVTDDDRVGLTFNPGAVNVNEGGTSQYTVVLDTEPTVTVTVAIPAVGDVTAAPASLTFTTGNWDTAQPVTVTAGQDDDGIDDNPMLVHTASGGDYDAVTGTVSVTVMDDDPVGLTFNPGTVNVNEGGTSQYTVVLDTEPTATVTVAIPAVGDVTVAPASLTFTTGNWNTAQPVTITAGQDDDGIDDNPMLVHTASGGDYASVTGTVSVTVLDDDTPGARISTAMLAVAEGGQATYTVRLNTQPGGDVMVTVGGEGGDVSVTNSPLTFTTINWATEQTVTVNAAEDDDAATDTVTLTHAVTGYGTVSSGAAVVVTVTENDTAGLTFNPGTVNVNEGGPVGTYTVVLDTQPTATVTVAIPAVGDVTAAPASLTFTTGNWNTAQPVTITAGQDADGIDDNPMLVHTASGGDYGSVAGTVSVRVTDDDRVGLTFNPDTVNVNEGGTSQYTVVLDTEPTVTVTVAIPAVGDVTAAPASLTFTIGNWDTAQPVTVTAGQDDDGIDDNPMLVHTASGGDYDAVTGTVSVTVMDDDPVGLTFNPGTVNVNEGESGQYTVALDTEPTVTVTVAIPAVGDVTVAPASLTFTTGNWNTAQPVTITAGQDDDGIDDNPMLVHTASGGDYASVTGTVSVTVMDDDTPGVRLSTAMLAVAEGGQATYTVRLNTQPGGDVMVTVGGESGDVSVTNSPLTFTTINWATEQTVTVNAAEDDDAATDTVTLTHAVTGYGTVSSGAAVVVTVTENDTAGLTFNPGTVNVNEGGPVGTYTVVLDTQPTATVTVAIPAVGDVTTAPASLTFTTGNWNTAQPVTVTAGQDDDGIDDNPMLVHTASGGDYGSVAGTVSVRVTDDDRVGLTFNPGTVNVNEGGTSQYTVVLDTEPTATVTVAIPAVGDVTAAPASLTFTTGNWDTAQPVTVTAGQDDDGIDDNPMLVHTASGGDYDAVTGTVSVTVMDDDPVGLTFNPGTVNVNEGGTSQYTVVLDTEPTATVTVAIPAVGDVTVAPASLTFTTGNWNTAQPVTVTAGQDDDGIDDNPMLVHTASGGDYASVTGTVSVTVMDDDTPGVRISTAMLAVAEGGQATYTVRLNTQPGGDVMVTVGGESGDVSVTNSPLTFTTINWATEQTVTVNAAEDDDAATDTVTLTHAVTGYGTVSSGAAVVVTVTENDTAGLTFNPATVDVDEGGPAGSYTVALDTEPTATVTVAIPAVGDVTAAPASLTFTTDNWDTAQPVTVTAGQDDDGIDDNPMLVHTASGGDYDAVTGTVTVTVMDDDPVGLTFNPGAVNVNEGESGQYTVVLRTEPTATVTVAIPAVGDVTAAPASLTFTTGNWDTAQPVTVTASQDADGNNDNPMLVHTASGGDYDAVTGTVSVTVMDDDPVGLTFNPGTVNVNEGGTSQYTVVLDTEPTATVTVAIPAVGDVTAAPASLTFTTGNWNTAQPVTVTAGQDADGNNDNPMLVHTASGGDYDAVTGTVSVTVMDDDTPGARISTAMLAVAEGGQATYTVRLNTQPGGDVMVTVGGESGDVSVTNSPLTFTTINWATEQTVTVNATEDDDAATDTVTLTHVVTGYGTVSSGAAVVVTVTENDTAGLTFNPAIVDVDEGGPAGSYTVVLRTEPTATVTVAIPAVGDVTAAPASLTFTTGNWNTAQPVTVTAGQDDDGIDDNPMLVHTASGGDYASVTGTVSVTVMDDDPVGLTFNPGAVNVNEGGTSQYTVVLDTEPTATVTVAIPAVGDVTTAPASLTFTTGNWNTAQPVTVTAGQDADGNNDNPMLVHTASGGDYGSVTGTVSVRVTDDDTAGLTLTPGSVDVDEGGPAGTYTVVLDTEPTATVTVAIPAVGDVTATPASLTFTTGNWNTAQPVTVTAGQDADGIDDNPMLVHTASGGDYGSVTGTVSVRVTDDDTAGLTLTPETVDVDEGGPAGTYTVVLDTEPTATVTVAIPAVGDVTATPASLTFTTGNWNTAQPVTVTAGQDADGNDDNPMLVHTASGGDYGSVTGTVSVRVTDDDTAGLTLTPGSVDVDEGGPAGTYTVVLDTEPTATVTVATPAVGDVTAAPASLTFTIGNWDTAQPVTVTAGQDDDGIDDNPMLVHTASGGDYDAVTGTVSVTVMDDDPVGLTFNPGTVNVNEGESGQYTVVLDTEPTATVTVAIPAVGDVTVAPASLTFTTGNWNTAQPVTITAGQDDDGIDDNPMLVHTASGGDYASVTGTVSVTVMDDDTPGARISTAMLAVAEGGQATYTVRLNTQPGGDVMVTVGGESGDVSVTNSPLTFTTINWATEQTVTVNAAEDDDAATDTVTLTHAVTGYGTVSSGAAVVVTVTENDTAGLTFNPATVDVDEGGPAGTYTVVLDTEPTDTVTVAIPAVGDVTAAPASLTFTIGNWNTAQPVTVTAGQDADGNDDNPMLVHTASGGDYGSVTGIVSVTVMDDDTAGLTLTPGTVNVNEGGPAGTYTVVLNTEPTATVTVTIPAVGDVTATPASLTFTTGNWNTAQSVTVTAGQDDDGNNDNPMLVHTASGGDYGSVTGTVSVRVTDDDTAGLTLTPETVDVNEGGPAGTYTVVLDTEPTATVTVAIPAVGDVTATPASLTFTIGNWNTAQPVTVTAGQDADGIDDNPMLVHTASGGDYGSVTGIVSVTVMDDDTAGLTLTPGSVDVDEGGPAGTYTVVLDTEPIATVTVAIPAVGDVTATPASLTFTIGNWDTAQPVTVTAGQDDDGIDDNPMLVHTASGGDYGSVTGTVSVTVMDDDTAGLTLTPGSVDVDEGGPAGTYTVVLDTEPTATVTVAIPAVGDVTAAPASLTFTTGNWNTAQPVTVTAGQDDDGIDDNPMLVHTASGGDYASVTGTVTVTVMDDDTAGLTLTPGSVDVDEGGPAGSYTVVLDTEPTATVTVAIPAVGDVTATPASLTFTTGNWNAAQPVTVTAGEDADGNDDNPMLVHTASGGDYDAVTGTVSVTVMDDDRVGLTFNPGAVNVNEGGTSQYTVVLDTEPIATVTVAIPAVGDVTATPASLTFTTGNWNTAQPVTVTAGEDADGNNDNPMLVHTASGGDYGSVTGTVSVRVTDDDTAGLTLTPETVDVDEGGPAGTYTVVLDTEPTATVTVAIPAVGDVTATPASLTFTTGNWDTAQPVTITAGQDADGIDDNPMLVHTASGGDYGSVTGTVSVRVTDDDTAGLTLTPETVDVDEGGPAGTYTVVLDTEPTATVTVAIPAVGDVTAAPASLTFTTGNWDTAQPVTVTAGQDDDGIDDNPMLVHTASGGDYDAVTGTVSVTVMDDDPVGLTFNPGTVNVNEGGTSQYTVVLDTEPTATVTVAIPAVGDVTVAPASLTFTTGNWNTAQPVTITAGQDDDGIDDNPMLVHTASGGDYASVTGTVSVTVLDNDTPGVRISTAMLAVAEGGQATYTVRLNTQPGGDVMVTVGGEGGDVSVTNSPLTFTTINWATEQTVTVNAAEDDDAATDTVTLTHAVTGYGTVSSGAAVVVTVTENDTAGLTFNPATVDVDEGGPAGSYTVALDTEPTATVTVAIPAVGDVTATPASLTFTTGNWDTAQPVTVTASQDADGNNDNPMLVHTASGGDYGSVAGTVSVRVTDDDRVGLTFNPGAVNVNEGGTSQYTVVLDTEPTVTVTVAIPAVGDVTAAPASLTFTTGNWDTAQPVTVTAGQDDDGIDDNPMLVHTASGGDYDAVTGTVSVTVMDDDPVGLTFNPGTVNVNEGGTSQYTVVLDTEPTATVTVAIPAVGDVTVAPASLTFTTGNWNTAQPVTITAGQDDDGIDDNPMLVHTASGGDYASVTGTVSVTVMDDDTPGARISTAMLAVAEGGQATYTVRLNTQPGGDVMVTVGGESGDVSVTNSPLTFTTINWATEQTVTVNAAEDDDAATDTVTLTHAVTGYGTVSSGAAVVVTVTENDTVGVTVTETNGGTTVAEPDGTDTYTVVLNTQPTANVVIAIAGNADTVATVSPASLTFTMANWNAAQTVTVTGVNDSLDNPGDRRTATITHRATSTDTGYNTVTASVTVTVTDDDALPTVPSIANQTWPIDLPIAPLTLSAVTRATGTPTYALTGTLPAGLTYDDSTRTISGTPTAAGVARLTYTVTDAIGITTVIFTVTISSPTEELTEQLNEQILPQVFLKLADVGSRLIADRLSAGAIVGGGTISSQAPDGEAGSAGLMAQLGQWLSGDAVEVELSRQLRNLDDFELRDFIDGLSFAAAGEQVGMAGGSLYGIGNYTRLSGDEDGVDWDGDLYSGYVGLDTRLRNGALAGVLLSYSKGEFEYANTVGGKGEYDLDISSVNPYIGWSLSEDLDIWASVGYGVGEVELNDNGEPRSSDLSVGSVSVGASGLLAVSDELIAGGRSELHLRGDGSASQVDFDRSDAGFTDVSSHRLRLIVEASHLRSSASGSVRSGLELGVRHDGGDGQGGQGLELGGSIEWSNTRGLTLSGRTRVLTLADYDEWGVSGILRLSPGQGGRGLSFSLSPGYGRDDSGTEQLWQQGASAVSSAQTARLRMDGEVGYGLWLLGGTVQPYVGASLLQGGGSTQRMGARLELGRGVQLELEGSRHARTSADAEHRIELQWRWSW